MIPRRAVARATAAAIVVIVIAGCRRALEGTPAVRAQAVLDTQIAALDSALDRLAAARGADRRMALQRARAAFKQAEYGIEYFAPLSARRLNGAPLDRFEDDAPNVVLAAEGFQVAEAIVYARQIGADSLQLPILATRMRGHLKRSIALIGATPIREAQLWDAARLELARLSTILLGGFDSGVADRTAHESAEALVGLRAALAPWHGRLQGTDPGEALDSAFLRALAIARAAATSPDGPDRAGWDRLAFLTNGLLPLAQALREARVALGIDTVATPGLLRADAASPYDSTAFDIASFRAPGVRSATPAQIALGAALFASPALSGDGTRSCASCHDPAKAFTDGRPRATRLSSSSATLRNTPTLLNAALQGAQFADGRVTWLEDQVTAVVGSRDEMHGTLDDAAKRIGRDSALRAAYTAAHGPTEPTGAHVREAVAAFVRTLVALDAPFDRYIRGESSALTAEARRGFTVFMGKGRCGSCHFAPLFNGTIPTAYTDAEYEVIGVPATAAGTALDPDEGRFAVTGSKLQHHAFKTPTVRNAAVTAPYMHNGVFATLDDVITFYAKGGAKSAGARLPNLTLPFDSLSLDARDRADLTAFLHALTDTIPCSRSSSPCSASRPRS
jgi:cytochrome c peroxidase